MICRVVAAATHAPGPRQGVPGVFVRGPWLVFFLATGLLACGCTPSGEGASTGEAPAASGVPAHPGRQVYARACVACHGAGLVGAPKLGDRTAWAPRIARGRAELVAHAIEGFRGEAGVMPPKGGHAYLEDDQVAAAVDFMVNAAR